LTGQLDIFSMGSVERPGIEYPKLPEFSARELLMQEKEASGMYFSGHLLDGFSVALSAADIMQIRDILQTDVDGELLLADRARVTAAGIVTSITRKTTKRDERMAFFTLEDRYAEIECIVFPKTLQEYGHVLREDCVVRVVGDLSVREEENPKILVSRLEELFDNETMKNRPQKPQERAPQANTAPKTAPSVPQSVKILYLRVPDLHSERFLRVKTLLDIFEGNVPVSVYDASSKTYHKQQAGFDCTPYTLAELRMILGAENVVPK
jgi:DNA polymerase-3 subunit alpha